jgi:succinoglycan biosynthesis transport protein ExoP
MNALCASTNEAASPLTLAALLAALRRRWRCILWPTLACVAAAGLTCVVATPRYRATAEIQIQKEDGGTFGLENTVTGAGVGGATDSLDYNMTLQTEASVLRSPALALRVIEATHLESTKDYFTAGSKSWMRSLFGMKFASSSASRIEPLSVPIEKAPNRRYAALRIFASHTKVQPVVGTRLIDISYTDPYPERAQEVANAMARALADITFEQRFEATREGSLWLSDQLVKLKDEAQREQTVAVMLQRGTGVFGNDASRNVVLERLDSLNQGLAQAQENRILKESIYRTAMTHSPEVISSLSGNSSSGATASINTSLTLIQGLRAQEATVRATLALDSVRYGPKYPEIAELKAQLEVIVRSIEAETTRLGERAHTDWLIAQQEEQDARAAFEQQKQLATQQNDSVIAYQLARQEAGSSRDLYESLFAKLKQATLLPGIRSNNVTVVSPASVPSRAHAASPNVALRLGAATVAGVVFGLFLVVVREATGNSLASLGRLEAACGVPLLAMLPALDNAPMGGVRSEFRRYMAATIGSRKNGAGLEAPGCLAQFYARSSLYIEGLRALRTSLDLTRGGVAPQVILITSCLSGEGKTTLAMNLAAMFAKAGTRTLLVDADLRRPAIGFYGTSASISGLATALSGLGGVPLQQPFAELTDLYVLAGPETPPYPQELLGSQRMKELMEQWREQFDVIVVDSPPALPVSDARLLHQLADVTLLVARHRTTSLHALVRTVSLLRQPAQRPLIGIVLNDVARNTEDFLEYFGHRGGLYASQSA